MFRSLGARYLTLVLAGGGFVVAIGVLLWMATRQRVYVSVAVALAFVILIVSFLRMRRPGRQAAVEARA